MIINQGEEPTVSLVDSPHTPSPELNQRYAFVKIGGGADKVVCVKVKVDPNDPKIEIPNITADSVVYYFPVKAFLANRARTLADERLTMRLIQAKLQALGIEGESYLAISLGSDPELDKIVGYDPKTAQWIDLDTSLVLEVPRAINSFEKEILDPNLTMRDRIKYAHHMIMALHYLHMKNGNSESGSFLHRDIKLENFFIYLDSHGKKILRLADFGKCLTFEQSKIESFTSAKRGNMRSRAAYGEGDALGLALCMIADIEEHFLLRENLKALREPDDGDWSYFRSDKERGVEWYIVNHEAFPGSSSGSIVNAFNRFTKENLTLAERKAHQEAIYKYIDALEEKLLTLDENDGITKVQAQQFCLLLKLLTSADQDIVPSMEDARKEFETIFELNKI
jgi:Protein kinase domain